MEEFEEVDFRIRRKLRGDFEDSLITGPGSTAEEDTAIGVIDDTETFVRKVPDDGPQFTHDSLVDDGSFF